MDDITLPQHEAASETRAAKILGKIDNLKESEKMGTPVNVFHTPDSGGGAAGMLPAALIAGMGNNSNHAGAIGGGLGAGLVGGLLGGLLFGRGGFGGGWGGGGVDGLTGLRDVGGAPVTVDMAATQTMGLMTAIGQLKDASTSGQMTIVDAVNAGFAAQSTNTLQQTIMLMNQANANAIALTRDVMTTNQNVSEQGCATRTAVQTSTTTISDLINRTNTDNLNRLLTVSDLDRRDEAHRGRSREVEVNVTQMVNQNQNQQQQQQQQQQIVLGLSQLASILGNLQIAQARQTSNVIGNTGAVTGTQTANPVNVM